jgi:hypothetical protein
LDIAARRIDAAGQRVQDGDRRLLFVSVAADARRIGAPSSLTRTACPGINQIY